MHLPLGNSPEQQQNNFGRTLAREHAFGRVLFAFLCLALAAGFFVPSHGARAAQVSSRSDTLSDSRPSATSNHTFAFTVNNAVYGSSITGSSTLKLTFPAGFSIPGALDCGDVDAATSSQFNFNWPACQQTATAWGVSVTNAISFVQTNARDSGNASTSNVLAFNSNNTAGNLIIAAVEWNTDTSAAVFTITDSKGNVYTSAIGPNHRGSSAFYEQIFYAKNITGGANTVTVKLTGQSQSSLEVYLHEYSGADQTSPLDVTSAGSADGGTAMDSGSNTTNFASELIFGFGTTGAVSSPGVGFTSRNTFNSNMTEDKQVSSAGSYNATETSDNGINSWALLMATFKAAPSITLVPPSDTNAHVATGTPVTIKIGSNATVGQQGAHWITNPAAGGVYTISVGGTFGGSGNMLVSINAGVSVQATVAESLAFTVSPSVTSIKWVQDNAITGQTTVTASQSLTTNNKAGNLIVVATDFSFGRSVVQVKDTAGNTYIKAMHAEDAGEGASLEIWYAKNIVGGANTVKVGLDAAPGFIDLYIHEYSGADLVSPLDVTASSTGSGTALDSGFATTNFPNELIFGFGVDNGGTLSTPGSTFTGRRTDGANITEDKTATTIGSFSATATINISNKWIMAMATFRPGPGCIGDDGAAVNAISTTATSVPFGIISPNTFYQGCQDLIVSTNAGNGYSVTVQESSALRTADGRFSIPDTTCDAGDCTVATATTWVTPTKNGFGHTCFNQSGSDCNPTYGSGKKFMPLSNIAAGNNGATIKFVQGNAGLCSVACTSTSILFTSNNSAGNLIVVAVEWNTATSATSSITDSNGNVYASAIGPIPRGGNFFEQIFYAKNITGGANTVSVKLTGQSIGTLEVYLHEYSGADTTAPLDAASEGHAASGTAMDSGSQTTYFTNELIFGFGTAGNVSSPGVGFTSRNTLNSNMTEDKQISSAGSYNATETSGDPGNSWALLMATFKGASNTGNPLMSSAGVVTNSTGRVKYRLSAGAAQPAGTYTTLITYTILGTF